MDILSVFLACLLPRLVPGAISCIGNDGAAVDWYLAYKLPRLEDAQSSLVQAGFGYTYMDSRNVKFELSKTDIRSDKSVPGLTLNQVYRNAKRKNTDLAYVFYDDEAPGGKEYLYYGHTKGDVAFDSESGFWLVHSVPGMPPPANENYEYPHSGGEYGQHFLCVTFNASTFDNIALQMRYNDPHIHSSSLPPSMADKFPNLKELLADHNIRSKPYHSYQKLVSRDGITFHSFAKSKPFHADLYHNLVAPSLKSDLLAETWLHSREALGPTCDGYTVEDISRLQIQTSAETFLFDNYHDHSKFAIGKSKKAPYVCVGDINRVKPYSEPSPCRRLRPPSVSGYDGNTWGTSLAVGVALLCVAM